MTKLRRKRLELIGYKVNELKVVKLTEFGRKLYKFVGWPKIESPKAVKLPNLGWELAQRRNVPEVKILKSTQFTDLARKSSKRVFAYFEDT